MASRRNLTLAWLVLMVASFIAGSQNWYTVKYDFNGSLQTITATGFTAWSLVNAGEMLAVIGFAAVALGRGRVRVALAWINAALASVIAAYNLLQLPTAVPASVNALVEKASGIAGGGVGGSSAAINSVSTAPGAIIAYAIFLVLLVLVQVAVATTSPRWTTKTTDKYAKTKATKLSDDSQGDNIALWDSQR